MVEKISVYPKFFLNKPIQFASDEVPEGIKCVEKSKFSHSVILVLSFRYINLHLNFYVHTFVFV